MLKIQIQNGRLHFNWLGQGGAEYPRYETVSNEFFSHLNRFKQFLAGLDLGGFKPNQWEITYVNHIPKETVWNNPSEWSFFRLLGNIGDSTDITEIESFAGEWHFLIPPDRAAPAARPAHRPRVDDLSGNHRGGPAADPRGKRAVPLGGSRGGDAGLWPRLLPRVLARAGGSRQPPVHDP